MCNHGVTVCFTFGTLVQYIYRLAAILSRCLQTIGHFTWPGEHCTGYGTGPAGTKALQVCLHCYMHFHHRVPGFRSAEGGCEYTATRWSSLENPKQSWLRLGHFSQRPRLAPRELNSLSRDTEDSPHVLERGLLHSGDHKRDRDKGERMICSFKDPSTAPPAKFTSVPDLAAWGWDSTPMTPQDVTRVLANYAVELKASGLSVDTPPVQGIEWQHARSTVHDGKTYPVRTTPGKFSGRKVDAD
jgi:hypothetical protein